MTLASKMVVLNRGRVEQIGAPLDLYHRPANLFVAGFIGTPPMNILAADVHVESGEVSVSLGEQRLGIPDSTLERYRGLVSYNGRAVAMGIRSEDLHPVVHRPELERLTARLELLEALGSETVAFFRIDARTVRSGAGTVGDAVEEVHGEEGITAARPNLVATFPPRLDLRLGDEVEIAVDVEHAHFFDEETGAALR
jgi:ABC-type sugar transport system ATPase subunit